MDDIALERIEVWLLVIGLWLDGSERSSIVGVWTRANFAVHTLSIIGGIHSSATDLWMSKEKRALRTKSCREVRHWARTGHIVARPLDMGALLGSRDGAKFLVLLSRNSQSQLEVSVLYSRVSESTIRSWSYARLFFGRVILLLG